MTVFAIAFFGLAAAAATASWRKPGAWLKVAYGPTLIGQIFERHLAARAAASYWLAYFMFTLVAWLGLGEWLDAGGTTPWRGRAVDWLVVGLSLIPLSTLIIGASVFLFMKPRFCVPVPLRGGRGVLQNKDSNS